MAKYFLDVGLQPVQTIGGMNNASVVCISASGIISDKRGVFPNDSGETLPSIAFRDPFNARLNFGVGDFESSKLRHAMSPLFIKVSDEVKDDSEFLDNFSDYMPTLMTVDYDPCFRPRVDSIFKYGKTLQMMVTDCRILEDEDIDNNEYHGLAFDIEDFSTAPIQPPIVGGTLKEYDVLINVNEFIRVRLDVGQRIMSVTGLPQGLKFSGEIVSGVALKAGSYPVTYTLEDGTTIPSKIEVCPIRRLL